MKTAEERAREVVEAVFDTPHNYELRQKNVAAIIRADREAVLRRVEEGLKLIAWQAVEADPEKINTLCNYVVAAVKKEVLL